MNRQSFLKSAFVTALVAPFLKVWSKDGMELVPQEIPLTDFKPTPCPPGMVPYTLMASVAACEGMVWPKDMHFSSYMLQAATPEELLHKNALNTAFIMVQQEISMGLTPESNRSERIKALLASVGKANS